MLKQVGKVLLTLAVALLLTATGWSQAIFSTVTGTVTDPTGAVIPGAKITLRNADSGDVRDTVADHQGYYTFASVPVGTYNLIVIKAGFQRFHEKGIGLGGGESRNVNVALYVGSASETIEVSGGADLLTPVNSGELADTLTTRQLEDYVQTGSNAAEYLKIMPGFGIQNGTQNKSNYTGEVIGINGNGDAGSQSPLNNASSYNGLPGNTLDIVSDGAHVSDPGCNCDTPVNPNSNFLQEFKVLASNFSAGDQKGPMVVTSVTKAGGTDFHGSLFFTARNYSMNSNDAYAKALGLKAPHDAFYYPGVSIGGPVIIPGTGFNKHRDKLFFFTGFEYFYQVLDTGVLTATVPTPGLIAGNFSPTELAKLGTITASGAPPGKVPASWTGGQMPANLIDPNMQALMKLYPSPNSNPALTGGFNYTQQETFNQNNFQSVSRADYSISDATKVWVRYNYQKETQLFPTTLWWTPTDEVPYPTPIVGKNSSNSLAGTLTHVFSPTLTNETVFAYTVIKFPNVFQDPSKVNRKNVGYNDPTLFNNGNPNIPNFGGNIFGPSEAALIWNPGGFEIGGNSQGLFADKYMPSASDTVTKVFRKHTASAGFFYESIYQSQPTSDPANGTMAFNPLGNPYFTYGDTYADMLSGNLSGYQEANKNVAEDISYQTIEGFVQDAWQATPKLTIDAGLRVTHLPPWTDNSGNGYSIFVPSQYSSANNASCAKAPTFCGFSWHGRDSAIPVTGFPTRALYYQPRVGFAYDAAGSGNTVIRGGWGIYYFHASAFTRGLETSFGINNTSISPNNFNHNLFASQLDKAPFTAVPAFPLGVDGKDDKQPYIQSYNLTLSQKTPWSGLAEMSYIGNVGRDLINNGGYGSDVNLVQPGAMFNVPNPGIVNGNLYRPYPAYGQINITTNNLYTNYNGLQIGWIHQSKSSILQFNYTWSKSLGIVSPGGFVSGNGTTYLNPFNLRANYGTEPGDRRQLFNAVYSINLPSPIHGNIFAAGVVNGWQISGLTQLQSGADLTANTNGMNFNFQYNNAILPGTQNFVNTNGKKGIFISSQSILGTPDIPLQPIVTCNPTRNLAPHQFVNGNCFTVPTTVGQNGPTLLPAIYGPAYFDSDLGLFKNFALGNARSFQFRVQAQNFLNHPLYSFPNTNNLSLNFKQTTPGSTTFTQTNKNFGYTNYKQGKRIVELVARFYF